MSTDNTKKAMPFLLSDERINDPNLTIPIGAKMVRDIYETARQQDKARIAALEFDAGLDKLAKQQLRDQITALEGVLDQRNDRIEELTEDRDNLRAFIDALIRDVCWGQGLPDDMDGGSVQDMAERMGVIVQVPHALPCEEENCGCDGEEVDFLYQTKWKLTPSNT